MLLSDWPNTILLPAVITLNAQHYNIVPNCQLTGVCYQCKRMIKIVININLGTRRIPNS